MHIVTGCVSGLLRLAISLLLLVLAHGARAQDVDYCNLQFPASFSAASGTTSPVIYGRIYEDDNGVLTSSPGAHPAIVAELGYGPLGSDPRGENPDWRWIAALYNVQVGNDDEYLGSFTLPFAPTSTQLAYTYRFSVDSGADFTYCDTDGNGSNGGLGFNTAALGTLTISSGGLPTISINDVSLSEGNSGTTAFAFTIGLSGPSLTAVSFDVATADNTATAANGDYASQSLTGLSIPAGQLSASFTVQVNGDTTEEPNETFFVNLTNVTGATVTDGQGTGTIINDDDACAAIAFPYTLGSDAPGELIQAIQCANANGAGSDTIDLDGRTIVLTETHAIAFGASTGLPQVTTSIVIQNGAITRSSADQLRHFAISGDLTLNDVSLSNGNAMVDGGSIATSGTATLTLNRCRLLGNTGNFGGAVFVGTGTTAVINNSLLSGNRATAPGGAIRTRGALQLNNSTVAGNFTSAGTEGGGGIASNGGSILLNNTIIAGNEASNFPATNEISGAFTSNSSLVGGSPGFVAALDASDNAPTTAGNYRLAPFSTAIDAGDNGLEPGVMTIDVDGLPRFVDDADVADAGTGTAPIVDLGAHERQTGSQPVADLAISLTDGQSTTYAGFPIEYTLTASNAGPDDVSGVMVSAPFTTGLSNISWTCVAAGGATCTAAGTGEINDSVALPAGSSATYTATATIDASVSGLLVNVATIGSGTATDPVPDNNQALDSTNVELLPQLSVLAFAANEGDSGTTDFNISVSLSTPAPPGGVRFDIATADGSAMAGVDYVPRSLGSQVILEGGSLYEFQVSVLGDSRVESDETFRVAVSNVTGATVAVAEALVTINNDDVAGVTIAPATLNLSEGGNSGSYAVALGSEPAATVTINIAGDAHASASPAALTFTAANWNVAQPITVTAIDDGTVEGPHTATVSHAASGGEYTGLAVASVLVNIADNDSAGLIVTESGGTTAVTEGGASDTFSLVLSAQPTADVSITLTADAQLTTAPTQLIFTASNWNVAQTATVTAVDDPVAEGAHSGGIAFAVSSADAGFNGLSLAPLAVSVSDNDVASVVLSESDGATAVSEAGGTDTYSLALGAAPTGTVVISVLGDSQVSAAPTSLSFTAADWNVPQTITVTALDDAAAEGTHSGVLTHSASGAGFDGIGIASVVASITDNDFTVGGSVSGLTAAGLVLQNNGADDLALSGDGDFTFGTALSDGSSYAVTVLNQPAGQFCAVTNGSGALAGGNITGIGVNCSSLSLILSTTALDLGNLNAGASSGQLTLSNAGSGDVIVTAISTPAAPFSLTGGTCLALPRTLAPGESCSFELRFAPSQFGSFSETLLISSTAEGSPQQVSLRGALVAPVRAIPGTTPWSLLLLALAVLGIGGWRFGTGRSSHG